MDTGDSVTEIHPLYRKRAEQWKRCRDCIEGSDAVKGEGQLYLPSVPGQSGGEYTAFQRRGDFYPAATHTHRSFMGMFFARDPIVSNIPEWLYFDSVGILSFCRSVCDQLLSVGRVGMLIDYSEHTAPDSPPRPYVSSYTTESITNWKTVKIKGKEILTLVVLKEQVPKPLKFGHATSTVYRVLKLEVVEEQGPDPVYVQEIHAAENIDDNAAGDADYKIEKIMIPRTPNGKALSFIPFYFTGVFDLKPDPDVPPLLPVVDINLSHYRTSAMLEHARHYAALPTAWVAGFEGTHLQLGPENVWVTDNVQARAGFLELSGTGLAGLENGIEHKERQMALVGSRLLEKDKAGTESGDSLRVRKSGEQTIVAALGNNISKTLDDVVRQVLEFENMGAAADEEQPYFQLSVDNSPIDLPPGMVQTLAGAVSDGLIAHETYFNIMQKMGIVKATKTFEEELELINQGITRRRALEQEGDAEAGNPVDHSNPPAQYPPAQLKQNPKQNAKPKPPAR